MGSISTGSAHFSYLNCFKIILLYGFIDVLPLYINNLYTNTLVELGGGPRSRLDKRVYLISNFNYFDYVVPIAIIIIGYVTDKYGAKTIIRLSIYTTSILIVLLSISPNLFFIRITLIGLGLSSGLKVIPYGLIAILYESKHQSFAYALIIFSSLFNVAISDAIGSFFGSYKNQIPDWFILKLTFLQYPLLFPVLCSATVLAIFGYYFHYLLPSDDKLDNNLLLIKNDKAQASMYDTANPKYVFINSSQDTFYSQFLTKLPTKRTSLLIVSYVLNQCLTTSAMMVLPGWYIGMFGTDRNDLVSGFESFFPATILFIAATLLLSSLYLPTALNKFKPSYVYNIACSGIFIVFLCLIIINFLQPIIPISFLVFLVNLAPTSLLVCFLCSNFSVILLLAKVEDINVGKFTVLGLAFGSYDILDKIQGSLVLKSLLVYFSAIESWNIYVKVSLFILGIIAFLNRYLSQVIFINSN
ncbi:hypothetical protein K502DRAFT_362798 [Neoconidiobolus thromboides FSU 785]|nr:hypothetical protein K502DRAFT_362798 [Neoconidiobolus thromboides FSU 785]